MNRQVDWKLLSQNLGMWPQISTAKQGMSDSSREIECELTLAG